MTITQIKIALLTAQLGSISAAARDLDIPQPNASSGIRTLEKEIGFTIFQRSKSGIVLTEKGQLFLEHARRILDESDQVRKLSEIDHVYRFRVGCMNYYRGREAFILLCREHRDDELTNLQYYNVSMEEGMDRLHNHTLDLVIGLTIAGLTSTINELAREKQLICHELGDTPPMLSVRKDHPIVTNHLFKDGQVDPRVLPDFPYVAYHNINTDFNTPYYKAIFKVPCKYTIFVDEKETRYKVVASTDAFNLGGIQSQETLDRYGLVQFPYPGYTLKMIYICRRNDEDNPEIRHFIDLAMGIQG